MGSVTRTHATIKSRYWYCFTTRPGIVSRLRLVHARCPFARGVHAVTAVVLFTRDLRLHDHPALDDAIRSSGAVIPLFVFDDGILQQSFATPNRISFLLDCIHDLRDRLRKRGADLVVGRGDPVAEALRQASAHDADTIYVSADVSHYAQRRERARTNRVGALSRHDRGTTTIACPVGGDHYRVFTPYWRMWRTVPWGAIRVAPTRIPIPEHLEPGSIPSSPRSSLTLRLRTSPPEVRRRAASSCSVGRTSLSDYTEAHDDLATDATSRISPFCTSAACRVARARDTVS